MSQGKNYNENSPLTVGILRGIVREEVNVKVKNDVDKAINKQDESYARMFGLLMEKLDMVLYSMNEYRQETRSATASSLRNEREIEKLGDRVLKLETVK